MEYIVSGQICGDPEAVYRAENGIGIEEEVVEEPIEEEEPKEEDHPHDGHGNHGTEEEEEEIGEQIEALTVGPVTQAGEV